MGIFTRVKDIINSNINGMLDTVEDPEKMVKMIIYEMEDALVDLKASCAGAMAARHRVQNAVADASARAAEWESKARRAVAKGLENLAREALLEKRRYTDQVESLENEKTELEALIDRYQEEMKLVEAKIKKAKEKQRVLVQRHIHARVRKQAEEDMRRFDDSEVVQRLEEFEGWIDRMEAEADLVNFGRNVDLEEKFERMEKDDALEVELNALKQKLSQVPTDDSAL